METTMQSAAQPINSAIQPSTTRLSDAMLMGDGLRSRNALQYLTIMLDENNDPTGRYCGCALGGAVMAMGSLKEEDRNLMWPWIRNKVDLSTVPFLSESYLDGQPHEGNYDNAISFIFMKVTRGLVSFEQLVDWVRRVEPEPASEQDLDVEIPLTIVQIEAAQDAAENIEDLGTVGPFTAWI